MNEKEKQEKKNKAPDLEKPYVIRNFLKEIRRITWPVKKKNYNYFFFTFVFIVFLIAFFALVSSGTTEIIKLIGAN